MVVTKGLGFKAVTNRVVKVKTSSHKIHMTLTLSKKISQISLGAECQSGTGDTLVSTMPFKDLVLTMEKWKETTHLSMQGELGTLLLIKTPVS